MPQLKNIKYDINSLSYTCSMLYSNCLLGVIGLTNIEWEKRQAELKIFLNENISDNLQIKYTPDAINNYLEYITKYRVHYVSTITYNNNLLEYILKCSNMTCKFTNYTKDQNNKTFFYSSKKLKSIKNNYKFAHNIKLLHKSINKHINYMNNNLYLRNVAYAK